MLPIAPEVFLAEKFNVLFRTMNEQLREPPPEQLALEMPPTPRWPGWHDDPNDPASLRYGDGGQRTEQGAPKTAAGGHRSHSFDDFDPRQYLSTYFSTVMEDERELVRWLVEHGRQHVAGIDGGQRVSMLDLGCGPTVHHILPLWDLLVAVTVMDLLPGNLDEISRWLHAPDNGHDWGPSPLSVTNSSNNSARARQWMVLLRIASCPRLGAASELGALWTFSPRR